MEEITSQGPVGSSLSITCTKVVTVGCTDCRYVLRHSMGINPLHGILHHQCVDLVCFCSTASREEAQGPLEVPRRDDCT
jgi:hypothetical protein